MGFDTPVVAIRNLAEPHREQIADLGRVLSDLRLTIAFANLQPSPFVLCFEPSATKFKFV